MREIADERWVLKPGGVAAPGGYYSHGVTVYLVDLAHSAAVGR